MLKLHIINVKNNFSSYHATLMEKLREGVTTGYSDVIQVKY
jgi:hypothetical protein